jgi:Domain of unknown function (DUF4407)
VSTTDPDVGIEGGEGSNRYAGAGNGVIPVTLDGSGGYPSRPPITLDGLVEAAGGRAPENFPPVDSQQIPGRGPAGGRRILGLPGRFLLRLINVLPDRCPPEERTKFYLMAATVLLNALAASYTVPTGLSAAYPGMNDAARLGLALLGAGVVGVIDALIVGYWISPAKYLLDPPLDVPPPLPGPRSRFAVFLPRLAFTGIIVFSLGLLLTLSANMGVINKQLALDAIKDRNNAIATAQQLDDSTIAKDTGKLVSVQAALTTAEAKQTADANRLTCELYGKPRVPGCSPDPGDGPVAKHFQAVVEGSDQQTVNSLEGQVTDLNQEISNARADKLKQEKLGGVTKAAAEPTGLAAVHAAWNQYAAMHGFDWIDRHLMDLLVLAIDIVPLGMKLLGGLSNYEGQAWIRAWEEAVAARYRRETGQKRLTVFRDLYGDLADRWRGTRVRKAEAWLDTDANDPGEMPTIPSPPFMPESPVQSPASPPSSWDNAPPAPRSPVPVIAGNGDPIREGRDARVGDVVSLSQGRYKLLAAITSRETCNTDAFIAGLIRSPGQMAIAGRDVPLRTVKFTRIDTIPTQVELDFVNQFPAAGETLLRTIAKPTAHNRRLIYESPYFPRSDLLHYLYGQPRAYQPRVTVGQVIAIMKSINDAHQRIWEDKFLHNDTRLRNIIMAGPLGDGRANPLLLSPRGVRDGQAMLCDWGSMSKVGDPVEIVASVLESDPAVIRVLMGYDHPQGPNGSAASYASDQYSTFACAYQLLTGCVSPTEGLLVYKYGNETSALAELESGLPYPDLDTLALSGWPDALVEDPLPVRDLNPAVPQALADLVDAGVRANPQERRPQILGIDPPPSPGDVARALRDAINQTAAGLTKAELDLELPRRHARYMWELGAPVGWPSVVLDYITQYWPEYGG